MARGLRKAKPLQKKRTPMKWREKAKARDRLADERAAMTSAVSEFKGINIDNVYSGPQNTFPDVGADNRILGMENPFAGMTNPLAGMQTEFENKM